MLVCVVALCCSQELVLFCFSSAPFCSIKQEVHACPTGTHPDPSK